jgi:23S rRNA (pseudouridine1915-N3)-methyltransferase
LIDDYTKRLSLHQIRTRYYTRHQERKKLIWKSTKEKEGELILAKITPTDQLILLDENGKNHSSVGFSEELQKKMNSGVKL